MMADGCCLNRASVEWAARYTEGVPGDGRWSICDRSQPLIETRGSDLQSMTGDCIARQRAGDTRAGRARNGCY